MQWNYSGCGRVFSAHVPLLRTILGDLAFSHGYDVYLNDNTVHGRNTLSSSNLLRSRLIFTSLVPRDFYLLLFSFTTLEPLFSSTKLILYKFFILQKFRAFLRKIYEKYNFNCRLFIQFIIILWNYRKYIYNTKKNREDDERCKDIRIHFTKCTCATYYQ